MSRDEQVNDAECMGIFRERAHSPGREADDADILRLTGKHLEAEACEIVAINHDAAGIGVRQPAQHVEQS